MESRHGDANPRIGAVTNGPRWEWRFMGTNHLVEFKLPQWSINEGSLHSFSLEPLRQPSVGVKIDSGAVGTLVGS